MSPYGLFPKVFLLVEDGHVSNKMFEVLNIGEGRLHVIINLVTLGYFGYSEAI